MRVATDLMRAFRGYGQINQFWGRGWNKYHSIQTSFNRRFTDGLSFGVNWTLGLIEHDQLGRPAANTARTASCEYRADQEEADELLGRGQLQRHTIKGNVRVGSARPRPRHRRGQAGARRGGQRLAAVGHLHRAVRRPLHASGTAIRAAAAT